MTDMLRSYGIMGIAKKGAAGAGNGAGKQDATVQTKTTVETEGEYLYHIS